MTKAQDNQFPYWTVVETAVPATPSAGQQRLYIDPADHKLKLVNSAGAVTIIATGTASAGALVLLGTQTAAGSASLNFTSLITSTYDEYRLELLNLIPATNGVSLYIKLSTDNGATWLAGTGYRGVIAMANTNNVVGAGGASEGSAQWNVFGGISNNTGNGGISGTFRLYSPAAGAGNASCMIMGESYSFTTDTNHDYYERFGGRHTSTTPINAIQVLFSSGNVATGIARLYGVAKT